MVTGNLDADSDSLCDRDIDGGRSNRPKCIIYATVLYVYKLVRSSWTMGGVTGVNLLTQTTTIHYEFSQQVSSHG